MGRAPPGLPDQEPEEGPVLPDLLPHARARTWSAIEHDFALNETILRMLILKIDPKLVDTMLTLARDEHALALQTVVDERRWRTADGGGWRRRRRPAAVGASRRAGRTDAGRCAAVREAGQVVLPREWLDDRVLLALSTPACGRASQSATLLSPGDSPMANLNKVMLIGRLTRDPEIRTFANGGKVAKFGFAVNNRRKNQQTGQWEDEPVFIDVEAFNRGESGKLADLVEQYLRKGSQVFIEGHLKLDQWTDKDGQKRSEAQDRRRQLPVPRAARRGRRRGGRWRRGAAAPGGRGSGTTRSPAPSSRRPGGCDEPMRRHPVADRRTAKQGHSRRPRKQSHSELQEGRKSCQRRQRQPDPQGQARRHAARADRGRAAPRQAGRRRRGQAGLRPQLPAAATAWPPCRRAHNLRLLDRYKIRVQQAREAKIADLKVLAEQIQRVTRHHRGQRQRGRPPVRLGRPRRRSPRRCKAKNLPVEPDMVKLEGADQGMRPVRGQAEPRLRHRDRGQGRWSSSQQEQEVS